MSWLTKPVGIDKIDLNLVIAPITARRMGLVLVPNQMDGGGGEMGGGMLKLWHGTLYTAIRG